VRNRLLAALGIVFLLAAAAWLIVPRVLAADLVRQQVERELSSRLGQPVRIGSASVSVFPRIAIDLQDLTMGQPAQSQLARVRLVVGVRGLLSRRIENARVLIDDGRIVWPLPFGAAGSGASETESGLTIASVREIQFRNVTFVTSLPPVTIDLDASLSGDRLDITRLTARSGANRIDASGAMTSLSRLEGQFSAKGNLTFAGLATRNFTARIAVTPRGISLSSLTFGMFDGKFDGSLGVDLRDPVPQIQLRGSVTRLDVAALVKSTGAQGGVTGRLVGTVSVTGAGSDGPALMRTAHGNIRVTVVDGTLPYIDIVRPVVLAFGKPSGATPSGSGSSFSSLAAIFTLADATLTTGNLTLQSRDFTAHGPAVLHVDTGAVDSHVDLTLSQELSAQAGTDLRRYASQNGRVVVPATIGGTLTHPSVFIDPAAAVKRAAEDELKREAGSLLHGLIKKKGGGGR
jgi:uncharacterized protein involved in outer membrane biogenesis